MARNGLTLEECEKRIASQMSPEERRAHAHQVILNSKTREDLEQIIDVHWNNIIQRFNNTNS